jgi:hypothetical protein
MDSGKRQLLRATLARAVLSGLQGWPLEASKGLMSSSRLLVLQGRGFIKQGSDQVHNLRRDPGKGVASEYLRCFQSNHIVVSAIMKRPSSEQKAVANKIVIV